MEGGREVTPKAGAAHLWAGRCWGHSTGLAVAPAGLAGPRGARGPGVGVFLRRGEGGVCARARGYVSVHGCVNTCEY